MDSTVLPETGLFRLVFLVAGIVIAVFCSTVLVALVFMPNQLIASMFSEDLRFLLPMTLSTLCSGSVLVLYARSHRSRFRK